jgi:hypothetical protein
MAEDGNIKLDAGGNILLDAAGKIVTGDCGDAVDPGTSPYYLIKAVKCCRTDSPTCDGYISQDYYDGLPSIPDGKQRVFNGFCYEIVGTSDTVPACDPVDRRAFSLIDSSRGCPGIQEDDVVTFVGFVPKSGCQAVLVADRSDPECVLRTAAHTKWLTPPSPNGVIVNGSASFTGTCTQKIYNDVGEDASEDCETDTGGLELEYDNPGFIYGAPEFRDNAGVREARVVLLAPGTQDVCDDSDTRWWISDWLPVPCNVGAATMVFTRTSGADNALFENAGTVYISRCWGSP